MREVRVQKTRNGWHQVVRDGEVFTSYRGADALGAAEMHAEILRDCARILDQHIPERGPCGVCGSGHDQSHRVIDAIGGMALAEMRAGDLDPWWVSAEFGYPESEELVLACLEWAGQGWPPVADEVSS